MTAYSRRSFCLHGSAAIVGSHMLSKLAWGAADKATFHISAITDEISQDFEHACSIAADDFGLRWVELRGMWGQSLVDMGDADLAKAEQVLAKHGLRVTDIASPLYKSDWPGAPRSQFSPKGDFGTDYTPAQQDELLERCIALATRFKTERIRCFDFWRLEDVKPHRSAIDAKLQEAATTCGKQGLLLVLENEQECNTATAVEAARTLSAVPSPSFMMNWDPGNAVASGEENAWPTGWNLLPKHRIGHCHCKNTVRQLGGGYGWAPVDKGIFDWVAQFNAFQRMGYRGAVSLETHWRGAGTEEASSRISMAGLQSDLAKAGLRA